MTTTTAPVEAPEEFPEDVMKIAQHYIDLSRQFGAITTAHIAAAIMQDRRALTTSPATDDIGRLVERARRVAKYDVPIDPRRVILDELIPAILSQQSEINRLREALVPFAKEADDRSDLALGPDIDHWSVGENSLTLGDLRRARAALPKAST